MQPSPTSQVITADPKLPVEAAAENCAKKLRLAFLRDFILVFNLLILGVDPDGSPLFTLPRPQSPARSGVTPIGESPSHLSSAGPSHFPAEHS